MALRAVGAALGVASWCLASSCTSSQVWRLRSQLDSVSSGTWTFEGLWSSCVATSTGSLQCNRFRTTLGLPVHLQVCRALMVLSLLLALCAIFLSVSGLKCVKMSRMSAQLKEQVALSGGVLFILSGVLTLTAVSWYAARVINHFYNPLNGGARFELGKGLYLGWASSSLALLGGCFLCCSFRRATTSDPDIRNFSYKFSSGAGGQSIYRAAPPSDAGSAKAYV